MKITNTELKFVSFSSEDVIATSGWLPGTLTGQSGFFYVPAAQYSGTYTGTGDYVEFSGTFGNYNGSAYEITGIYGAKGSVDSDKNHISSKQGDMVYFDDTGVSVPAFVVANFAKSGYDAYAYGNGQYYTDGVSFYDKYWQ